MNPTTSVVQKVSGLTAGIQSLNDQAMDALHRGASTAWQWRPLGALLLVLVLVNLLRLVPRPGR